VFHSSLLTVKNVNLVVARDGFFCVIDIVQIFHSSYLDYRGASQTGFVLLCNKLNIADREGQWILQFQMITGVRSTIDSGDFDNRHTFQTALDSYCCVTG